MRSFVSSRGRAMRLPPATQLRLGCLLGCLLVRVDAALLTRPALGASHLAELKSTGFTVVPNYLPPQAVQALQADVETLTAEGRFAAAGVGEASTNRLADEVRRCEQCFVFPAFKHGGGGAQAGRDELYGVLDGLQSSLEAGTGVALDRLLCEGLYARYPNGGYYRRHVDAVAGTASDIRQWSYLLYLNTEWSESDGGCLRIHTDGGGEAAPPGASPSYVDVEPRAGTLVLFRSTIPHEVLNTSARRLAVAGWFNTPVGGSGARRTLIAGLAAALVVGGAAKFVLGLLGGDD